MATATMSGAGADVFARDDVAYENGQSWSATSPLQKSPVFNLKMNRQNIVLAALVLLVVTFLLHHGLKGGRKRRR